MPIAIGTQILAILSEDEDEDLQAAMERAILAQDSELFWSKIEKDLRLEVLEEIVVPLLRRSDLSNAQKFGVAKGLLKGIGDHIEETVHFDYGSHEDLFKLLRPIVVNNLTFVVVGEEDWQELDFVRVPVKIHFFGEPLDESTSTFYFTVGVLPAGASRDIDGSGLSNWGNSQQGGFRALPADESNNDLASNAMGSFLGISPQIVQDETRPSNFEILDAEGWAFKVSEPSGKMLWDEMAGRRRAIDDWLMFRWGDAHVLVWRSKEDPEAFDWTWSPSRKEGKAAGMSDEDVELTIGDPQRWEFVDSLYIYARGERHVEETDESAE